MPLFDLLSSIGSVNRSSFSNSSPQRSDLKDTAIKADRARTFMIRYR